MTSLDVAPASHTINGSADPLSVNGLGPIGVFGQWQLTWKDIAAQLHPTEAAAWEAHVKGQQTLDVATGRRVADLVMGWAKRHGATHYAHWFHPLTGKAAEKHDGFLTPTNDAAPKAIDALPWKLLVQGEPDASSFPSGGLRATHAARGYTVWDPTSPLFIRDRGGARTLAVPCIFISYDGQALDYKTPLLRAQAAVSREAARFVNLVCGSDVTREVVATLGIEQEYFLVDQADYLARPDLQASGRTLMGAKPTRGQQFEDNYFHVMGERVQAFQAELEQELFRLGIPIKTRHGEVAPGQFELAPQFEPLNVAIDHNLMTMELMATVAERHGLVCLLHEKPFAGVNGSGKHSNWSLATDSGENLLDPGQTPAEQQRFLAVLAAVLLAVHRYGGLLRASVATAGNDHRLGANEAPPPIVSAYLGSAIDAMVQAVVDGEAVVLAQGEIKALTECLQMRKDATDRNRTAPFAFTGNKFEFRAVGASDHCAWPMTVLNAAVAEAFRELSDRLEKRLSHQSRELAVKGLIRDVLTEVRPVCFEGDGYSEAWRAEAERRGLPVLADTPAALELLRDPGAARCLLDLGVLRADELEARYVVFAERYAKQIVLEAETLSDLALTSVLPAIEEQLTRSGAALQAAQAVGGSTRLTERVKTFVELAESLQAACDGLASALARVHEADGLPAEARLIADVVKPAMAALRAVCDQAEGLVADALWPMPKYRELLFAIA